MNPALLSSEIQQFIHEHLHEDTTKLVLKHKQVLGVPIAEIIEQIEAKRRCEKKLPTWFSTENIYYPNKLNIEQTSSEATARYKSDVLKGKTMIDLTGGFGVDCLAFSKRFAKVTHCEISKQLSEIVTHNYSVFGVENIKTISEDGIEFLKNSDQVYDCIYVDPSRRNDAKGKVFLLEDCLPDVVSHQQLLLEKAEKIMIKTSPLLDITNGLRSLQHVSEIHVVALQNEMKELLWIINSKKTSEAVCIKTTNLKKTESETFEFYLSDEKQLEIGYADPKTYLYEPNSAVMKAGGFSSVAKAFTVEKLHPHSHLYTADALITFPGRRFKIEKVIPYTKKIIKKELNLAKANITTRNFPESVAEIRKKFKIADGGTDYLFFTTIFSGKKVVLYCKKAQNSL